MMFSAARVRSAPQTECNEHFLSIMLAERKGPVGGALGNSYDMGHGSYPRCERRNND